VITRFGNIQINLITLGAGLLLFWLAGCADPPTDEMERVTVNRLESALEHLHVVLLQSSSRLDRTNWGATISTLVHEDALLADLLTKQRGLRAPAVFLNTNLDAWITPTNYWQEIAIISPELVSKNGQRVHLAIRFNGEITRFECGP